VYPLVLSDPLTVDDIIVSGEDSFSGVDAFIELVPGETPSIRLLVSSEDDEMLYYHGQVVIKEKRRDREIDIPVTFHVARRVQLAPSVLVFKKENGSSNMVASAIVRIHQLDDTEENVDVDLRAINLTEGASKDMSVETKKISDLIYRVLVRSKDLGGGPDDRKIRWEITINGEAFIIDSLFVIGGE
jgi:hypothetical protein